MNSEELARNQIMSLMRDTDEQLYLDLTNHNITLEIDFTAGKIRYYGFEVLAEDKKQEILSRLRIFLGYFFEALNEIDIPTGENVTVH